jgi:hypothetical protein
MHEVIDTLYINVLHSTDSLIYYISSELFIVRHVAVARIIFHLLAENGKLSFDCHLIYYCI